MAMATSSATVSIISKLYLIEIHLRKWPIDRANYCLLVSLDSRRDAARGLYLDGTEIAAINRGAKQIGPDSTEVRG